MLTNEELQLISDVARFLEQVPHNKKATYLAGKLAKMYIRVTNNKMKQNERSNEYNKKNKEYHKITNAIHYHKKRGNWTRVSELKEELENLNNRKIPLF